MSKFKVITTQKFRKSFKKVSKYKNFKEEELEKVLLFLKTGQKLDIKYRDHNLSGDMRDLRECHITSDILLIYKIEKDVLVLLLMNIGSHSELFG